jgi:UDP-N-acetylmuramoyl-L-alanyl-D-glutamate--2,6-diaminopimelate ligase
MRLSQLLPALPKIIDQTPGDPEVAAIEHDSRRVTPGALFVARRGGSLDGHRFIPQAIERGAVAVVVEKEIQEMKETGELGGSSFISRTSSVPLVRVPDSAEALAWLCAAFHDFPARKMVMIGVTGTDGKTTTCILIHSILIAAGIKAGLISTVNAVIGDQVLDTGLHTTTPDAPDVQRYLAQMVDAGMTHCVLETTSHGLAQHRVTACEFDIAVVTNITHEHLDFHGSLDAYRAAKAKLFEGLATAYRKPGVEKMAVLNADDESFEYLRGRIKVPCISYGFEEDVDVQARRIRGTRVQFNAGIVAENSSDTSPKLWTHIQTQLIGKFNVANCLAAFAVGLKGLMLEPEVVARGIAEFKGVPGRMEFIDLGQDFIAVVDFAHTPNALKRALEAARWMQTKVLKGKETELSRVIVVFGSAGLRDVAKRRWMGEVAAELADCVIITAEDPRTESLEAIMAESAEGAKSRGGVEGETFWRIADRGEAIQFAVDMAEACDVVIACGKAHEQSMCFGKVEYPWDDRVAMRAALAKRLGLVGPEMPLLPTSKGWKEK